MLADRRVVVVLRRVEAVLGAVRVTLQVGYVFSINLASSEPSIDRALVQHEGILDIISGVTHDGHHCVLAGGEMVVLCELDRPRFHHRFLRVDHQIEDRVDTEELVRCDGANRLFTHCTLVGVTR